MSNRYPQFPQFIWDDFPVCTEGLVQTHSEVTGMDIFDKLADAIAHATTDKTVWKISYQTEDGWRRFVIR